MTEKEFIKLNRNLQKQQRVIAKERARQSPSRISEVKCSTLKNRTVEEAGHDERCERCGKSDCELVKPAEGYYKSLCTGCETKLQEIRIEESRAFRRRKRDCIRYQIENIIPKAYQHARLRHLGGKFKRELLSYDKTTGIVLFGPAGTGKTYALCGLLRTFIASGLKCERIGYEELCLMIRNTFRSKSSISELDILDKYRKSDILLIEDLGSSKSIGTTETDFSLRVFYVLINSRLEAQQLTLISTNKTLANLRASFDEPIGSRLALLKWIGVGGNDRRLKQ